MAWVWLILAGLCEVIWAVGLKRYGLTVLSMGGCITIVMMILSFAMLAQAMRTLPVGTSYPVWVGIGAVGTAIYGSVALGESTDWRRWVCIGLITAGVIGLKLWSPAAETPVDKGPVHQPAADR